MEQKHFDVIESISEAVDETAVAVGTIIDQSLSIPHVIDKKAKAEGLIESVFSSILPF